MALVPTRCDIQSSKEGVIYARVVTSDETTLGAPTCLVVLPLAAFYAAYELFQKTVDVIQSERGFLQWNAVPDSPNQVRQSIHCYEHSSSFAMLTGMAETPTFTTASEKETEYSSPFSKQSCFQFAHVTVLRHAITEKKSSPQSHLETEFKIQCGHLCSLISRNESCHFCEIERR